MKKHLLPLYLCCSQLFLQTLLFADDSEISPAYPVITNTIWQESKVDKQFYDDPYRISLFDEQNGENSERLWSQSKVLFGLSLGVAGVIAILPEETSNWGDSNNGSLIEKWVDNITEGPSWDRDGPIMNYIGHPYFGGVYYLVARKSGYRQWDSFIYSAMMSTFFWECGIESFAEVPSIQDIVVTPVAGWVVGEWFYQQEQMIRINNDTLLGSEILGNVALIMLDPIDALGIGINKLFGQEIIKSGTGYITYNEQVIPGGGKENIVKLNFAYEFDSNPRVKSSLNSVSPLYNKDPINTSVVGISTGVGYGTFDPDWRIKDKAYVSASIGMYFSKQFSASLTYATTHTSPIDSDEELTWENYNISGQYYFNTEQDLRPYLTFGIGEMLKDQDNSTKTFQTHYGAGLYYKLSPNWAWQTDWRLYHSSTLSRIENTITSSLIYRFGPGESTVM